MIEYGLPKQSHIDTRNILRGLAWGLGIVGPLWVLVVWLVYHVGTTL